MKTWEKWSEQQRAEFFNLIKDHITDVKGIIQIVMPSGDVIGDYAFYPFEDPNNIVILPEWESGRIERDMFYWVPSKRRDDELFIIGVNQSSCIPYWATIMHYIGNDLQFNEFYEGFENVIEAINKILAGELPYRIISRTYVFKADDLRS